MNSSMDFFKELKLRFGSCPGAVSTSPKVIASYESSSESRPPTPDGRAHCSGETGSNRPRECLVTVGRSVSLTSAVAKADKKSGKLEKKKKTKENLKSLRAAPSEAATGETVAVSETGGGDRPSASDRPITSSISSLYFSV